MIFLSDKLELIVFNPKNGTSVLARFKDGKCTIDEEKKTEIELMKSLGYKYECEIIEIMPKKKRKNRKEVI